MNTYFQQRVLFVTEITTLQGPKMSFAKSAFALSAFLAVPAFSQPIVFDIQNAFRPLTMTNHSSDPAIRTDFNNWGVIGGPSQYFYKVYSTFMYSTYALNVTSDETKKENIQDLPSVSSKLKNIRTVKYDLKKEPSTGDAAKDAILEKKRKDQIGFLAQDLMKEFPEVVEYDEEAKVYSVAYTEMIPILLKAINEQQIKIDELEKAIKK